MVCFGPIWHACLMMMMIMMMTTVGYMFSRFTRALMRCVHSVQRARALSCAACLVRQHHLNAFAPIPITSPAPSAYNLHNRRRHVASRKYTHKASVPCSNCNGTRFALATQTRHTIHTITIQHTTNKYTRKQNTYKENAISIMVDYI